MAETAKRESGQQTELWISAKIAGKVEKLAPRAIAALQIMQFRWKKNAIYNHSEELQLGPRFEC